MKRAFLVFFALSLSALAQAATRPVVLNWTASTSTSVTKYSIYGCTAVSPATSCTPDITGTPIATVSGLTYTEQTATGNYRGYYVVAVAPACSSTSSITTPCGNA